MAGQPSENTTVARLVRDRPEVSSVRRFATRDHGEVHLARRDVTEGPRWLRVKILAKGTVAVDDLRQRATRVDRVRHGSLPFLFEVGEHEGVPWTVEEFIAGCVVASLLDRLEGQGGRLPVPAAVEIARDVASATAA